MKRLLILCTAVSLCALDLAACSPSPKTPPASASESASAMTTPSAPSIAGIPTGDYKTDKAHTSLTFTVSHLGYSHYTGQFGTIDAALKFDPAHPDQASLTATIDPASLDLTAPPKGFHDELIGKGWLNAAAFPKMTFISNKVELTGANTAKVTGDFNLHGITRPVTLDVTFNGGYAGMAGYDPNARIGFSATGSLKRSDFGITYGIPAPGTNMGVSDQVDFHIETEMTGPALKSQEAHS